MKIQFYINEFLTQNLEAKMIEGESPHLAAKRLLEGILNGESTPQTSQVDADVLTELQSRLEKLETQEVTPIAPDALEEIRDRLNKQENYSLSIQECYEKIFQMMNSSVDTISQISDRLTELEKHRNDQQETRDFLEKIMDEKRFDLLEQYGDRLTDLEESIGMSADDLDKLTEEIKGRILDESLKPFSDRLESLEESLKGWISGFKKEGDWQAQQIAHAAVRLDALEKGKVDSAPREIPKGLTHKEMSLVCGIAPSNLGKVAKNRESWPEGYLWSDESKKWFPMEV